MRNRVVGILVIIIAIFIGFIIFSFNIAMSNIVDTSCSHGPSCPMWGTIEFQTNMSIGIMAFVIIIGLYLVFFGEEKLIVTKIKKIATQVKPKEITKESYADIIKTLSSEEKLIVNKLIESRGTIFQSDLVNDTGIGKVRVTRILDKLEGRKIIERKRRGMTNVVVLKAE